MNRLRPALRPLLISVLLTAAIAFLFLLGPRRRSPDAWVDSTALPGLAVLPTLDSAIPEGKSAVWCSTFQVAWSRLAKDVVKSPPVIAGAEDLCRRLNAAPEGEADLPPGSFYAAAGWTKDGIVERIRREMAAEFPAAAIALRVQHHFHEVEGKGSSNSGMERAVIAVALQCIHFRLDQNGAELTSEAKVLVRPEPTQYVFDRPFLIFVRKRPEGGAGSPGRPFFALWVDGPDVLVPFR